MLCVQVTAVLSLASLAQAPAVSPGWVPVPQLGECWGVTALAFSPDGRRLAAYDGQHPVVLWDIDRRAVVWRSRVDAAAPDVAWSPDGRFVAFPSHGPSGSLCVSDAATGERVQGLEGIGRTDGPIAFAPEGGLVACGAQGTGVGVWDLQTGKLAARCEMPDKAVATAVSFGRDGRLAVGADNGKVFCFDAVTGRLTDTVSVGAGSVTLLRTLPTSGELMAFCKRDPSTLWREGKVDPGTLWYAGKARPAPSDAGRAAVRTALSPDGSLFAGLDDDNTLTLWDAESGEMLRRLPRSRDGGSTLSLAFSPDSRRLALGHFRCITVWDPLSGEQIARLPLTTSRSASVACDPVHRRVAVGFWDGTIALWDSAAGQCLQLLPNHSDIVEDLAFSADGALLAAADRDNTASVWDAASGELRHTLVCRDGFYVQSVAFSPDGRTVATGGSDGAVILWDVATGERLRQFEGAEGWVCNLAFSPDGGRLAASISYIKRELWQSPSFPGPSFLRAMVWDVATQEVLRSAEGSSYAGRGLGFTEDGRTLIVAAPVELTIDDPRTGDRLRLIETRNQYVSAASPTGRQFAVAEHFGSSVYLTDVASGNPLYGLDGGHHDWVDGVAVEGDDGRVFTTGHDGIVCVWDSKPRRLLATLWCIAQKDDKREPELTGEWLAWTPEGYYDCSPGGEAYLYFRDSQGNLKPAEELSAEFHQPERLRAALSAGQ